MSALEVFLLGAFLGGTLPLAAAIWGAKLVVWLKSRRPATCRRCRKPLKSATSTICWACSEGGKPVPRETDEGLDRKQMTREEYRARMREMNRDKAS